MQHYIGTVHFLIKI